MKRTVILIIIGTCCGMTIGAYAAEMSRAGIFSFSGIVVSNGETDARDANNRVVVDARAADALASLFRDGLFEALVVRDAPTLVTAHAPLARFCTAAETWFRGAPAAAVAVTDVFTQALRRTHEVHLAPSPRAGPPGSATPDAIQLSLHTHQYSLTFSCLRC